MNPTLCWLACVLAGSLSVSAAVAQPFSDPRPPGGPPSAAPAAPITLPAAVDAAWARAVQPHEVQAQRQRALAEQTVASAPWAAPPALGLSHRDDRLQSANGARETEASLSWPLWLPGQRAAWAATAGADLSQAEFAGRALRLRLAGEVREWAWRLVALQAEFDQAAAQRSSLQTLSQDVERRVAAGDLARADALAARAELMAASAQQAEAAHRLAAALAQWRALTGMPGALTAPGLQEPAAAQPLPAVPAVPDAHPELLLADQAVEVARLKLERQRLSRREPPELTLRWLNATPGRQEGSASSLGIAIRVPLGTADRNQPLQAAALGEWQVAQAQAQRVRDQLQANLAAAWAALTGARAQASAELARADLLQERATLIDKSFRAGESPLPELLRALSAAAQARSGLIRQQAAAGLALAQLNQALGVSP